MHISPGRDGKPHPLLSSKEYCEALLVKGLDLKEMLRLAGTSERTFNRWLNRHGLTHRPAPNIDSNKLLKEGVKFTDTNCHKHGLTVFVRQGTRYRCKECRNQWGREAGKRDRPKIKARLANKRKK